MNPWEIALVTVVAVVGTIACAVVGCLAWIGWRISKRGPF